MTSGPKPHGHPVSREFKTDTPDRTAALGRRLGQRLQRSLVLLLFGDLGSGKTAFAQGLARGLDVPAAYVITSPTYTLINAYPGRLPFYHVDLYRLPQPADPEEIGLRDLFEETGVVAVEWAERLHPADRPPCRLELHFEIIADAERLIGLIGYGLDPTDLLKGVDS
ncbi:MAG: tRNA (adenosine(37)-N6)-threonylcarbamoyltransferase complex ATPase subunit type 1 TsaE [Desulfosarcina sp.]